MSSSLQLRPGQEFIYKTEILQVFKPQNYQERRDGVERERLAKPQIVEIGWFDLPGTARNFGSNRTGRKEWYNNIGKPKTDWRRVHKDTNKVMHKGFWPELGTQHEYEWREIDLPQPFEPDRDYRVYKIPVNLDMGEAILLPALKRLYEVE